MATLKISDLSVGDWVRDGGGRWSVHYKRLFERRYDTSAKELVDALYDMAVKLKERGVI